MAYREQQPMRGEPVRPQPKGPSRATLKGRKDRAEATRKRVIRARCVERDGYCRVSPSGTVVGDVIEIIHVCSGPSQWAHLGEKKRFKTRGQAPEVRHTTAGSLMLCTKHHDDYDEGRLSIVGDDANKTLRFVRREAKP